MTNAILARAQYQSHVVVPSLSDSIPMSEILRQTEALPPDTPKVRMLIAIAHIFDKKGEVSNVDTSLIYLRQAYTISTAIHDTSGANEVLKRICQDYLWLNQLKPATALLTLAYGDTRIRLHLLIAEHFVNHQPIDIPYLEKALPWLAESLRLADSMQSTIWRYEYLMVKAKYLFEHGEMENGRNAILAIINNCVAQGDKRSEGNYWSEMNLYMPVTSQTSAYHIFACRQSIRAYMAAGDRHAALYSLRDLAVMHRFVCQYDSAEAEFQQFLRETGKTGTAPSANTNYELSNLYLDKGDLAKALDYALRSSNALGRENNSFRRQVCGQLALIYQQNGVFGEELNFGQIAVEEAIRFRASEAHYFTTFVVDALVRQGYPEKALAYMEKFRTAHPPISAEQQEAIAYDYGLIYDALNAYQKADYWFRQLPDLDTAAQRDISKSIFRHHQLNPFRIHLYTGRFYVHWGKYQLARTYLRQAQADPPLNRQSSADGEFEFLLYKTDSALGDLRTAIGHYIRHDAIRDSIFNAEKMRQFQSLEVQYQAKQKEQSILLLRSESQLQRDQLRQASLVRQLEFGGIIVLLLLAGSAYYAYRSKGRNVRKLLEQQTEINDKNLTLERLLGEKNELLTEKNLLLQEVHHRVKNNLHTVMSLLEFQTAYLSDPAARSALLDSQNRIQTISLLHQKLYRSTNVTTLEMAPYIAELCSFLSGSLGTRERRITITQHIEPIELDISAGMPIGMLLNEAITNSIKHAFPRNTDHNALRTGHITVTMRKMAGGRLFCKLQTTGSGCPKFRKVRSIPLG
ncbi:tetratricopeptide repeat-containing sensor histidine kinase [Puia sp. P3]|uniref:tetratricopeptide repeat-containing sensor histidine kinase n=1 Tax=Puia sp. P3 TaxID=3423952 RepID=UPI003D66EA24